MNFLRLFLLLSCFCFMKNAVASDLEANQEKCSICLENLITQQKIVELPCKHKFHKECFDNWTTENPTCPLCRQRVNVCCKCSRSSRTRNTQNQAFFGTFVICVITGGLGVMGWILYDSSFYGCCDLSSSQANSSQI